MINNNVILALKNKSWIDAVLTFSRQFLAGLMQLCITIIVARALGSEGMGAYAVALLLPTLLSQLLSFGLVPANVYFLASRQFDSTTVWATSRDISVIVALLGTCLAGTLIFLFGSKIFPGVPTSTLLIAMFIFPASLLTGMVTSLFQAWQDFRSFNLLILAQPTFALLGAAGLLISDKFSLNYVIIAAVVSHALGLLLGLVRLRTKVFLTARDVSGSKYLGVALRYGMKAHVGGIATALISRSDIFMVNFFLGPGLAGIYTVAVRIIQQVWLVSQAASAVIFPKLSSMHPDEPNRLSFLSVVSSIVFWSAGFIAFLIFLLSDIVIEILFGPDFKDAVPPLLILLLGVLVFSSARVLATDFAARNLIHLNLYLTLTTMVINIIANWILIPHFGLVGAAVATSGSYLFNFLVRLALQQITTGFVWWWAVFPNVLFSKKN